MRILVVALVLFAGDNIADAAEGDSSWWPQFRGPNARGIATPGNYPAEFGPDKNMLWKVALPAGVSSPCVWQDRIFVTGYEQEQNVLETLCLDRASGEILWRRETPAEQIEKVHQASSPANATPATDGQRIVAYFASYGVLCYDLEGNELWKVPLPLHESRFGSGSSPIIAGELVILNRDQQPSFGPGNSGGDGDAEGGSSVLALQLEDGSVAWQTERPPGFVLYSTPVVWPHDEQIEVLLMGMNRLTSYDLQSGKELWNVGKLPPQVCATPQVTQRNVYVTATGMFGEPETFIGLPEFDPFLQKHDKDADGTISVDEIPEDLNIIDRRASEGAGNSPLLQFAGGLDRNGDKEINAEEWNGFEGAIGGFLKQNPPGVFSIQLGGTGNLTETNINWHTTKGVAEVPSLLVLEDRLFLVRNGGIVHCRNLENGEDLYRGRLGATGGYYASPVFADGKVYFASDRGVVTVIAADSSQLKILSKNDFGEPIKATPAFVKSTIYLRTDSHLYAIGGS